MAEPATTQTPASGRVRNDAIDLLRGLVIVIMALDHARDFFSNHAADPTMDLATTTPALFFTRWITHFCAPVFVFLAGTSAFLAGTRRTRPQLAWFLLTRGLWLLVAEVTLVRWGWFFQLGFHVLVMQVIWAIGISMIILAGLVFLPVRAVGMLGLGLIIGHDLLDGIRAADLGSLGWLWKVLHERGMLAPPGRVLLVIYPLLPWPGVMAAGYAAGQLYTRPADERRRVLLRLGAALTVAFVVVRAINRYGDPRPWTPQSSPLLTAFSFLACSKYPPSLCYLLMTLGPALAFLGAADGVAARWTRPLVTFGRVPFLFYVAHVPLLHGAAVGVSALLFGGAGAAAIANKMLGPPADWARYGFSLPIVYLAWGLAVLALYPVCRWFAGVKARNRAAWLSYL
jgi:uncharacterized membrane protein